jgi:hypothetical protein
VLEGNKVVVVGGWNGKESVAAIEVLEFKNG